MTDEQIIKAWECCANNDSCPADCPLFSNNRECFVELLKPTLDLINRRKEEIQRLENQIAINKGAMRAYREAFENAHDEAVADFSHFLIDKAKDGIIEICDLPDLVAEWRSPERKDAELMKEVGEAFQEGVKGGAEE